MLNNSSKTSVALAVSACVVLFLICGCVFLIDLNVEDEIAEMRQMETTLSRAFSILPNETQCGRFETAARIFGGSETALGEYPWIALLQFKNRFFNSKEFKCAGILITDRHILTAAHCFNTLTVLLYVRLGEHDLSRDIDCDENTKECADPHVNATVSKIMIHEKYVDNDRNHYNDIAILKLNKPVNFTKYIEPICLPLVPFEYMPKKFVTAGFGRTEKASESDVKMSVKLPLVNRTECNKVYGPDNFISEGQICAGGEKNKDACVGDSGGPLMVSDNPVVLMGITSYGMNNSEKMCGEEGIPGVYTYVPAYLDWILEKISL